MSSHQRGAKCCHWAWEGAPGPEAGAPETPERVQPHSLLRESVTGGELHKCWPSSQAPGLSSWGEELHRHLLSSQALGLFKKGLFFTGVRLLHRLRAFSKKSYSSQAQGFFQKELVFTGVRLLHRLRAF